MAEEQIIIEVVVDNSAAQKSLTEQTRKIAILDKSTKELKATNKELSKDYTANKKQIEANNEQITKNNEIRTRSNALAKQNAKELKLVNNSLNAQKAALKANKKAIGDVNTATKQGQKEYRRLEKEILRQTKSLREAENAQGTFTRGVGDYGQALSSVNPAMGGAVSGFQAMTKGALAFIATPIGAVIAALGLAIGALTEYFKGSEKGQNDLLKITNKLGAVFGVLMDTVRDVGEAIFEAVTNPKDAILGIGEFIKQNLINRFVGFVDLLGNGKDIIANAFTIMAGKIKLALADVPIIGKSIDVDQVTKDIDLATKDITKNMVDFAENAIKASTGVDDAFGKIGEAYDTVTKEAEKRLDRAEEISATQIKLAEDERKFLVENAKLDVQIANKRLAAKDEETRTVKERISLLEEAQDAENKKFDNEIELAKQRLFIQKQQNLQSDSTKEDLLEQAKLEAELIRLNQARANAQRKLETEIQTNIKKRDAAREKEANLEIARLKRISDEKARIDAEESAKQKRLEEEEQERKEIADKKAEELEEAKAEARVGVASQTFAAVEQFAEEGSALQKAAAIGSSTINTYQAITNALANVPAPFNIAAAGITGALGFAQVANIAGIFEDGGITKFANGGLAEGGMFEGASHANGGVKFAVGGKIHEAEGGEAIINKRSTAMFKPLLSSINTAGGGKKFANGGIPLASSSTAGIDSAMASENAISNQLSSQSPVQVAVTDINRTQSNVSVKQTRASI